MVRRMNPELCPERESDLALLRELSENSVIEYVGTMGSGTDYRDIYLVYRDGMLHIIVVRRDCPGEDVIREELEQMMHTSFKQK